MLGLFYLIGILAVLIPVAISIIAWVVEIEHDYKIACEYGIEVASIVYRARHNFNWGY